ncbi:hypothetical protein [Paraburkholderia sp. PGU19]|uniref:hypothetical protein n=1 Tax=Paraburkholderia sp. PGU19 TaxID=2735434 RepID=UPI0015DB6000|nr:hypothetical protein [Paraburkholderia sp. PGU19]
MSMIAVPDMLHFSVWGLSDFTVVVPITLEIAPNESWQISFESHLKNSMISALPMTGKRRITASQIQLPECRQWPIMPGR